MKMDAEPVLQQDLLKVVKFSSAFSLGTLAAFLCSVKEVNPHLQFNFSFLTVLAFVFGAGLSWGFWRTVLDSAAPTPRHRAWFIFLSVIMIVGTLAAYGYALASVPGGSLREIIKGVTAAAFALTLLGILFWKVTRCFKD